MARTFDNLSELRCLSYLLQFRWTKEFTPLYEEWFHCKDLGVELKPVIERFHASEQHKTGNALPGTILEHPPLKVDNENAVPKPFNLKEWVQHHLNDLKAHGKKAMKQVGEFKVMYYYGDRCNHESHHWAGETFIWQFAGHSTLKISSGAHIELKTGDSYLVHAGETFTMTQSADGESMFSQIDPLANKH